MHTGIAFAGVELKNLFPRTPFGPSDTFIDGTLSLGMAAVFQKPTPLIKLMASSWLRAPTTSSRLARANLDAEDMVEGIEDERDESRLSKQGLRGGLYRPRVE